VLKARSSNLKVEDTPAEKGKPNGLPASGSSKLVPECCGLFC